MPVLGVPLVIGTGCAWIHYLMLKDEIEKGEQAEKARQAEMRRLEEETAELKNALKELANETSSIVSHDTTTNHSRKPSLKYFVP